MFKNPFHYSKKKVSTGFHCAMAVLIFSLSSCGKKEKETSSEDETVKKASQSKVFVAGAEDGELDQKTAVKAKQAPNERPQIHEKLPQPDLGQLIKDPVLAFRDLPFPLVHIGDKDEEEDQALILALQAFAERKDINDLSALEAFLKAYPGGARSLALRNNLGRIYYDQGKFSQALATWKAAWEQSRPLNDTLGRRLADEAFAGYARMGVLLGRKEDLEPLLQSVAGREMRGAAAVNVTFAREALYSMDNETDQAFKCGPFAIFRMRKALGIDNPLDQLIIDEKSTYAGTSLTQMVDLAEKLGTPYQAAKLEAGSDIPLPAMVHWKLGHYSAIVARDADGRYVVEDTTFAKPLHIDPEVLVEESSGYFLLANNDPLPQGLRAVDRAEGEKINGRMSPTILDPNVAGPEDDWPCGKGQGMAVWDVGKLNINLRIKDTPLFYDTSIGPGVALSIWYNERESLQPAVFNYTHVGQRWGISWITYIEDNPTQPLGNVIRFRTAGGAETFKSYDDSTGLYANSAANGSQLTKTSANSYERRLSDGSIEVFDVSDGTTTGQRRLFRSSLSDPFGNALTFGYDAQLRLTTVTDAAGKITTLAYNEPSDPYRLTSVTDPYGRSASLEYNSQGQLIKITDIIGITSEFAYGASDAVISLTTPYGITGFDYYESGLSRQLTITDPQGERLRYEYKNYAPGVASTVPLEQDVAAEFPFSLTRWERRNTFIWDRKAMKEHEGDYTKALRYHWLATSESFYVVSDVPLAIKPALDNFIFFSYPGQGSGSSLAGTQNSPSASATKLPDGTIRITRAEYNAQGRPTKLIDPLARETVFEYAANGLDLLKSKQKVAGGSYETLGEVLSYNSAGQPLQIRDAAGQVSTLTYNALGQILTATDPLGRISSYTYQENANASGYRKVASITALQSGNTSTFAYDSNDRLQSVTSHEGYQTSFTYDTFGRVLSTTFPDSTTTTRSYEVLDLKTITDRLGRSTEFGYNSLRQRVWQRDAEGKVTAFHWCRCGDLEEIIDPMGRVTHWTRDLQGRVISKSLPDGRIYQSQYDSAGRLIQSTDPKGQQSQFTYNTDGSLAALAYANIAAGTAATVGSSYSYDPFYSRLVSSTDGIGTTNYGYHPYDGQTLGAGAIATIDGPWANDTLAYTYDSIGRLTNYTLPQGGESYQYDTLGRLTTSTTVQGAVTMGYDGITSRVLSVTRPAGLSTDFSYDTSNNDFRLLEILNSHDVQGLVSKHNYSYRADGIIQSWQNQLRGRVDDEGYDFTYDRSGQLIDAVKKNLTTSAVLSTHSWLYDDAGNRLSENHDGTVQQGSFNAANQLTALDPAGPIRLTGQVNKAATSVTVGGKEAQLQPNGSFQVQVDTVPGANDLPLVVTEQGGQVTNKQIQFTVQGGEALVYNYDLNGNVTSVAPAATPLAPQTTYTWNARDELVAITRNVGADAYVTEFSYNGKSQRIRRVEKTNGTLTLEETYLWLGSQIVQKRSADGSQVLTTYTGGGQRDYDLANGSAATDYFYTKDHLGSVREMLDASGVIRASYDYDIYGERVKLSGDLDCELGYTGHRYHQESGLVLTLYRAYDPKTGRWLSSDPIAESGGLNLYAYVGNDPVNYFDPLGLDAKEYKTNNDVFGWMNHWEVIIETNDGVVRASADDRGLIVHKNKAYNTFEAYEISDSSAVELSVIPMTLDEGDEIVEHLINNYGGEKYGYVFIYNDCGEVIDKVKMLLYFMQNPESSMPEYIDFLNEQAIYDSY